MHFFKRPLTRGFTRSWYQLTLDKHAQVICWDAGHCWRAKIIGTSPSNALVTTEGGTPREALRKLERKTMASVKALVKTFAIVFRALGAFKAK